MADAERVTSGRGGSGALQAGSASRTGVRDGGAVCPWPAVSGWRTGQAPCEGAAAGAGQVTGNAPGAHVGVLPAQAVRLHEELERAHDVGRLLRAETERERGRRPPQPARPPGRAASPHFAGTETGHRLPLGLKAAAKGQGSQAALPAPMGRLRAELTGDWPGFHTPARYLCFWNERGRRVHKKKGWRNV